MDDLDGDLVAPVPDQNIDQLQVQHVQQSVCEILGEATRVRLGPDDRQRREGGQITETATEALDIVCSGLCLGHGLVSVAGLAALRTAPLSFAESTRRGLAVRSATRRVARK